jgi:hypothetical protein
VLNRKEQLLLFNLDYEKIIDILKSSVVKNNIVE